MLNKKFYSIFQQGSKTYFYSSLFFPTLIRRDVFILYGFVRRVDNFIDSIPQKEKEYYDFKKKYYQGLSGEKTHNVIIDAFISLSKRKQFDQEWVDAFFTSMEMDLTKTRYSTLQETLEYIYGSAEVIGLMMARILNLQQQSFQYAQYLGRSMQYINFIRDIAEDLTYGRIYFPSDELAEHGIQELDYHYVSKKPEQFSSFMHQQINHYCQWQHLAEQGFKFIPKRYLIPVKTASEMYNWTAEQIYRRPFIVYNLKVKPLIPQILMTTISNIIDPKKKKIKRMSCKHILSSTNPSPNPRQK